MYSCSLLRSKGHLLPTKFFPFVILDYINLIYISIWAIDVIECLFMGILRDDFLFFISNQFHAKSKIGKILDLVHGNINIFFPYHGYGYMPWLFQFSNARCFTFQFSFCNYSEKQFLASVAAGINLKDFRACVLYIFFFVIFWTLILWL